CLAHRRLRGEDDLIDYAPQRRSKIILVLAPNSYSRFQVSRAVAIACAYARTYTSGSTPAGARTSEEDQLQPASSGRSRRVTSITRTSAQPSQLCIRRDSRARSSAYEICWRRTSPALKNTSPLNVASGSSSWGSSGEAPIVRPF